LKPTNLADCLPDELPYGWELAHDPQIGTYFINHLTSKYSAVLFCLLILNGNASLLFVNICINII